MAWPAAAPPPHPPFGTLPVGRGGLGAEPFPDQDDRQTSQGQTPCGSFSLIVKNVLHRPVRTVLTTLGLAIAIAAVIDPGRHLVELRASFLAIYNSKGIDLVVVHAGSSNQLSSSLDDKMADRLRQIEGVAEVAPSLVDTVGFEKENLVSVLVNGWVPGSMLVSRHPGARRPGLSSQVTTRPSCWAGSWP